MELELVTLFALFGVALVAGFIDAIAGGGGLLTVPALLATGMPPALVLGTNKLQSSFGSFSATWFYARKGLLEWAMIWPAVICTFIGAAIGTLAVQTIDAAILERLLPFLLMAFACYFYFSPRVSDAESSRRLTPMLFALLVGAGLAFMTGFSGRAQVRFLPSVSWRWQALAWRAPPPIPSCSTSPRILPLCCSLRLVARWCGVSVFAWRWGSLSALVLAPKWC